MGPLFDFFRGGTLRRQAVWKQVAHEHGGQHIIPKWYKWANERIEAVVSGVSVVLDTYEENNGNSSVSYTRCLGSSIVGRLPQYRVYKEGAFSSFGKMLGTQDLTLGSDALFDEHFMVKAEDPAATRATWTPSAQRTMREHLLKARVVSKGSEVQLVQQGKCADPVQLRAALELVAMLASGDCFGTGTLRAIGGPGFSENSIGYPQIEILDPAPVVIETRDVDGHLVSVASLKQLGDWKPVVVSIQDGSLVDKQSMQQFSPLASAQVAALGTATLIIEDALPPRIQWSGVEHASERLLAGARLLGALRGIGQQRL